MHDTSEMWRPGQGRRLRVFVAQRWGADETLFSASLAELGKMGFSVEDVSLAKESLLGPREDYPRLTADMAARIYASDILLAPAQRLVGQRDWVAWSVDLAGVCYSIPVLLVERDGDGKHCGALMAPLRAAHARCDVARPHAFDIAYAISRLLQRAPHQAIPDRPSDSRVVYRGPQADTLNEVMRLYPYRPAS